MAKTDLETLLQYGIDEKHRRIFFGHPLSSEDENSDNGAFTQTSVQLAVRAIMKMTSDYPKKPIEIHMNSYGGDAYAMQYLHDVMLASTAPFIFYGGGVVASSATWIMAASDQRYLHKHTKILIHDGHEAIEDRFTDLKISVEQLTLFQDELETIYKDNSRFPKSWWSVICKRDTWMSAEEVVEHGLADAIIEPRKRGNYRKTRSAHINKKLHPNKLKSLMNKILKRIHLYDQYKNFKFELPEPDQIDENLVIDDSPVQQEDKELKNE